MTELTFPCRLSIALVTRNRPEWLRQCLHSWRTQAVQPFEIVVSDDSDSEYSNAVEEIAREFHCRYMKGPRRGLYGNRNNAALACRGTHIMSADDDHTHPPELVRAVLNTIQRDPAAIWTLSERSPDHPEDPLPIPGELRSTGIVGPPEDPARSAAIACGSTVYPRKVFDLGFRCDESYDFGGLWYLWGHQLRKAGFRINHTTESFVWHHVTSSKARRDDLRWIEMQHECNLYVQAAHALWISRKPAAIFRAIYGAIRLLTVGHRIPGEQPNVRLRAHCVIRAFKRALQNHSLQIAR